MPDERELFKIEEGEEDGENLPNVEGTGTESR